MKIKVCGNTQSANLTQVADLMPDYLGFIFYKPSPRDVSATICQLPLNEIPSQIQKVAVLVDMPLGEALQLIKKYGFDVVQLHGSESPEYCGEIKKDVPVIKAFPIINYLPKNIDLYEGICDYFLFDTKGDKPGGTGIAFDHTILNDYHGNTPFFVSGGIEPCHAGKLKTMGHKMLYAADINSKFETAPGVKNIELVRQFICELKDD